jgi:sugar O-acyltransferase (sialic acid O-acetyltransferase NeuD family)
LSNPFLIFGASGHAKVVVDVASRSGQKIDFIADDAPQVKAIFGYRVSHSQSPELALLKVFDFLVAVGENVARERIFEKLRLRGGQPKTLTHPSAIISPESRILPGTLCCAGVVVNPDAAIGRNCILNTAATVDHDCIVGDHSHICPGVRLAGDVVIGQRTMIGTGAVILPGVRIGSGCVIGAGSVVNCDIPDAMVAYGVPAKPKRPVR